MVERHFFVALDPSGFLRRGCPLCGREFKVYVPLDERGFPPGEAEQSFLLVPVREDDAEASAVPALAERHCPYCAQTAPPDQWWTQQQVAAIHTVLRNTLAGMMNEHLVRPLSRAFSGHQRGPVTIRFHGRELQQEEEWTPPEADDMVRFLLPCCGTEIKIAEDWTQPVHCFYCGFPHHAPVDGARPGGSADA
jgi:hypothetical protein